MYSNKQTAVEVDVSSDDKFKNDNLELPPLRTRAITMGITPTPKLILVVRTTIYVVIVLCSFIIFSPLAISLSIHESNCLLYAEVKSKYGPKSTCDYSIAISVLFCLLYPIIIIILTVLAFFGKMKNILGDFSELPFFIVVILDTVILLLVLISACTISVGLETLCNSLVGNKDISCSQVLVYPMHAPHKKDFFYNNMAAAEGGAWTAFIMWLVQVIIGFLLLWKNGRLPCLPGSSSPQSTYTPSQEVPPKF